MTHSTQTLDIAGYRDEPVPNTFYRQDSETQHLAILLPDRAYTRQAPLLFYPARLLGTSGADVFFVEYAYNRRPDFLVTHHSTDLLVEALQLSDFVL